MRRGRVPVVAHEGLRRRAAVRRALWTAAELAVTLGLVVLLLVVHQLWWTNRQAREGAERKVEALERQWGRGTGDGDGTGGRTGSGEGGVPAPPADDDQAAPPPAAEAPRTARQRSDRPGPRWDQAYAVLSIPRLGLRVPVAEGISTSDVLNKGYVGHYSGTAQPGQTGNFAVAGHRNTHGEPFRYLPRLRRGDEISVETRAATFTYAVDRTLPRTSARDGGVLRAVPHSDVRGTYGYREPGYYITLTTCTPEYTSRYRLVVWGTLRSMRPR
jgi:sortase A